MPLRGTAVRSTPALVHSGRDEQAHAAPATCAGATHSANTSIAWRAIIDASFCDGQRLSLPCCCCSWGVNVWVNLNRIVEGSVVIVRYHAGNSVELLKKIACYTKKSLLSDVYTPHEMGGGYTWQGTGYVIS